MGEKQNIISVAEAQERITSRVSLQPYETVSLPDALGRVLAQDVRARVTLPALDASGVDGYAIRSEDIDHTPKTLHIIGEARASEPFNGAIGHGQTVRVYGGAPIPECADAVVDDEAVNVDDDILTVMEKVPLGMHIRYAGLDFTERDVVLKSGQMITARDIGLAAAMNIPWLQVRCRPRVAVIATGDELVMPGDNFGSINVFAATNLALCAFVQACGGIATNLGIAGDDAVSIQRVAENASRMDLMVTTGGLSGGAHELLKQALHDQGIETDRWQLALGTGSKPMMFGMNNHIPIMGFPGKPVTSMVFATVFLKPAIETMLGMSPLTQPKQYAVLGRNLDVNDLKLSYLRARLKRDEKGNLVASPMAAQDSFMLSSFAQSDCLIVMDPKNSKPGSVVEIIPLGGSHIST